MGASVPLVPVQACGERLLPGDLYLNLLLLLAQVAHINDRHILNRLDLHNVQRAV